MKIPETCTLALKHEGSAQFSSRQQEELIFESVELAWQIKKSLAREERRS